MNLRASPTVFWLVTGPTKEDTRYFAKKYDAINYASQTNRDLGYYFHNHVWENFDRTQLGKHSLPFLYKERAQQLRDKYDYLVLHYSGGSDSHNVLHTFLSNNIKLDEVTVRWPKHWIDGKFYQANNVDTSAKNAPSEYNYTIEPTLRFLEKNHPDIKINIVDFTEDIHSLVTKTNIQNRILTINSSRTALGTVVQRLDPSTDRRMASTQLNNVGHIFGIEKPALFLQDNSLYFYFSDLSFDSTSMEEGMNVEPFYWTPDYPLMTMEQIYQAGLFFKHNKQYLHLLNSPNKQVKQVTLEINLQQNLLKTVLYKHSWDFSKFQVDKPNIDRSDWYSWAHETPELTKLNTLFHEVMTDITSGINEKFLINTDQTPLFAPRRTKLFYLMDLS
jgi:hypothetical protein